jgi:hypothetical protein
MFSLRCILIAVGVVVFAASARAGYRATELFAVQWGQEQNELRIGEPFVEDVKLTPQDSTDDVTFPGGGPDQGFVDKEENCYFSSYKFGYFKGYDHTGNLIVDYSKSSPGFDTEYFQSGVIRFYMDTTGLVYFLGFPRRDYVAVADQNNNLLAKLNPYGEDSGVIINNFYPSSDDQLSFYLDDGTRYTYSAGHFTNGGAMGWKAADGFYYYANMTDAEHLRFMKYQNPDLHGVLSNLQETVLPLTDRQIDYAEFLGVDDSLFIYVYVIETMPETAYRVLKFNGTYSLVDEILLSVVSNRFEWNLTPFLRNDGNVYEFQVMDDGLHVFRWSRNKVPVGSADPTGEKK